MIIKKADGSLIEVNNEYVTSYYTSQIDLEIVELEKTISLEKKTDLELLQWAKDNYPSSMEMAQINDSKERLVELNKRKDDISKLSSGEVL